MERNCSKTKSLQGWEGRRQASRQVSRASGPWNLKPNIFKDEAPYWIFTINDTWIYGSGTYIYLNHDKSMGTFTRIALFVSLYMYIYLDIYGITIAFFICWFVGSIDEIHLMWWIWLYWLIWLILLDLFFFQKSVSTAEAIKQASKQASKQARTHARTHARKQASKQASCCYSCSCCCCCCCGGCGRRSRRRRRRRRRHRRRCGCCKRRTEFSKRSQAWMGTIFGKSTCSAIWWQFLFIFHSTLYLGAS